MGVSGLLRLVQPHSQKRPVAHYSGQILAVDAYSWLHRAAICCAEELIQGQQPTKLLQSIENRVRVYEYHNVRLYFVFDGAPLGMKERVNQQRRRVREAARASFAADPSAARRTPSTRARGVDITFEHAAMLIAYLKSRGIKFIVAPYEADSQLVYLEKEGIVHGIISEDSDLLVFGAQKLLTKVDARSGECIEVNASTLPPGLASPANLRALAIISGCDYSTGVNGMGPVKALKLAQKYAGNLEEIFVYMARANLIENNDTEIPFKTIGQQADAAFQYQRVWDPVKCSLTFLNVPPEGINADLLAAAVIGADLSRPQAHYIATGKVDPHNFGAHPILSPSVTEFVNKLKPFTPPMQRRLATPSGAQREAFRRLNLGTTPVTNNTKISGFFPVASSPIGASPSRPAGVVTTRTMTESTVTAIGTSVCGATNIYVSEENKENELQTPVTIKRPRPDTILGDRTNERTSGSKRPVFGPQPGSTLPNCELPKQAFPPRLELDSNPPDFFENGKEEGIEDDSPKLGTLSQYAYRNI